MNDKSAFEANLQRGELLRNQERFAEAESYLQRAITEEPENAEGYYQLAFCYCNWTGHSKKALEVIDRAISLEPNRASFFALRSWILGNLNKHKEALQAAEEGLGMSHYDILALNSRTRAYALLYNWVKSEESARETLSYYPRNELAANFLAQALRQQGKMDESHEVTARLLAQVPDSAMAGDVLQIGEVRTTINYCDSRPVPAHKLLRVPCLWRSSKSFMHGLCSPSIDTHPQESETPDWIPEDLLPQEQRLPPRRRSDVTRCPECHTMSRPRGEGPNS